MKMRDDLPIKKYPLIPFKTEFSSTCDFRHWSNVLPVDLDEYCYTECQA
jgi:hypothetical protein